MTQKQAIQLFEDRKVRTVWDERTETWYFSVLDVISALTDTVNPTDYSRRCASGMKRSPRSWGQIVPR